MVVDMTSVVARDAEEGSDVEDGWCWCRKRRGNSGSAGDRLASKVMGGDVSKGVGSGG